MCVWRTSGKFLGYIVNYRGIEANLEATDIVNYREIEACLLLIDYISKALLPAEARYPNMEKLVPF